MIPLSNAEIFAYYNYPSDDQFKKVKIIQYFIQLLSKLMLDKDYKNKWIIFEGMSTPQNFSQILAEYKRSEFEIMNRLLINIYDGKDVNKKPKPETSMWILRNLNMWRNVILNSSILSIPRYDQPLILYRFISLYQKAMIEKYKDNFKNLGYNPVTHFLSTALIPCFDSSPYEISIALKINVPANFPLYYYSGGSPTTESTEVLIPYCSTVKCNEYSYILREIHHKEKEEMTFKCNTGRNKFIVADYYEAALELAENPKKIPDDVMNGLLHDEDNMAYPISKSDDVEYKERYNAYGFTEVEMKQKIQKEIQEQIKKYPEYTEDFNKILLEYETK